MDIHALLERAAEHRKLADSGCCCQCGEPWPCLVTLLAAALYHLRKPDGERTSFLALRTE